MADKFFTSSLTLVAKTLLWVRMEYFQISLLGSLMFAIMRNASGRCMYSRREGRKKKGALSVLLYPTAGGKLIWANRETPGAAGHLLSICGAALFILRIRPCTLSTPSPLLPLAAVFTIYTLYMYAWICERGGVHGPHVSTGNTTSYMHAPISVGLFPNLAQCRWMLYMQVV